ncbi:hypothetical protein ABGB16_13620 [Micromonospora sp. B11E3]|uniref:hypothetical protein n=1 Tax=Micromonospora sp. B11E3 TaxID=3153562 RepID=UPI00325CE64D
MATSFDQTPFVLSPPAAPVERHGRVDLYLPTADGPSPAVVLVHGVPLPPGAPDPRDWLLYRGYGDLLAEQGLVAAVVSHRVHDMASLPLGAADVADAVALVRAGPRVDPERLVLWFFSGGGLLLADYLRERPSWLRGIAATYPLLGPMPGWGEVDERFLPLPALDAAGDLPIVLTRAGRDAPPILAATDAFTAAAAERGRPVRLLHVPDGRHGFDALDHTDQSRDAVRAARDAVVSLTPDRPRVTIDSMAPTWRLPARPDPAMSATCSAHRAPAAASLGLFPGWLTPCRPHGGIHARRTPPCRRHAAAVWAACPVRPRLSAGVTPE